MSKIKTADFEQFVIEQINKSFSEYKGTNEAIQDAAYYIAEFAAQFQTQTDTALNKIAQMSDCGTPEATIVRMKEIAVELLKEHPTSIKQFDLNDPQPLVEFILNRYKLKITFKEAEKIIKDICELENVCTDFNKQPYLPEETKDKIVSKVKELLLVCEWNGRVCEGIRTINIINELRQLLEQKQPDFIGGKKDVDEICREEETSYYQPLFDLMCDEHDLKLLDSEMNDIINVVNKMQEKEETNYQA